MMQHNEAVIDLLQKILEATTRATGVDFGATRRLVRIVTIVEAGTPVHGPTLEVPPGYTTAITMRRPSSGTPTGYVGPSKTDVGQSDTRKHLIAGEGIELDLSNLNGAWFDATAADVVFELMVEQQPRI